MQFVELLSNQHLKLFAYLNQLQLSVVFFFFEINKIQWTTSCIVITLSCWYFSDFVVLLIRLFVSWIINRLIIKSFSINFDVVIFSCYSWEEVFFERININKICITISIIISNNKQSFDSLITTIKQFPYTCTCIIWSFFNHLVFIPINSSFRSFT